MNIIIVLILTFLALTLIIYIPLKIYSFFFLKKCPYCKEFINKKAIKCKHCQSDLRGK